MLRLEAQEFLGDLIGELNRRNLLIDECQVLDGMVNDVVWADQCEKERPKESGNLIENLLESKDQRYL